MTKDCQETAELLTHPPCHRSHASSRLSMTTRTRVLRYVRISCTHASQTTCTSGTFPDDLFSYIVIPFTEHFCNYRTRSKCRQGRSCPCHHLQFPAQEYRDERRYARSPQSCHHRSQAPHNSLPASSNRSHVHSDRSQEHARSQVPSHSGAVKPNGLDPLLHHEVLISIFCGAASFSKPWSLGSSPEHGFNPTSPVRRTTTSVVARPITIPFMYTASPGIHPRISRTSG